MRMILPFAALLLLSANAQAQQAQPTEPASLQAPALVEPKTAPTPAVVNVQTPTTEVKPIETTVRRAHVESATAAEDAAVRQTVIPRGFWWLVGAVVIGGIILALIL